MAFPTTSVLDNFNRADSTSIGANWTEITNVQIVSNTLQSVSGDGAAYWNVAKYTDCEIFATIGATSSSLNMYLAFRVALASDRTADPTTAGNWSGYFLTVDHTANTIKLSSYNGSSVSDLTSAMAVGGGLDIGDKVGASVVGNTIQVWYATAATSFVWTELGTDVTNSAYTSQGRLWLELAGTGLAWDDFGGGTAVAATQVLRPSADSVDGVWTDQAAGTALAAAIDETTPSDSDYIQSDLAPANTGSRVKLQAGSDPLSSSGHQIVWRPGKSTTGGQTIDMTTTLRQGGGNSLGAGTLVAEFSRADVDAFTTYTETLSGAQADTITNYSDLYVEFHANASELLTWAPPGYPDYAGYTHVTLNNTGQLITELGGQNGGQPWIGYLAAGTDYVLHLDHRAATESGGVEITGGRNVVMIGGQIDGYKRPAATDRSDESKERGLTFTNPTGVVHLEGVWINGATDGISIRDSGGAAIHQYQNLRISNVHAVQDNTNLAHPDIIQNFFGPAEIRIDRLTADSDWTGLSWFKSSTSDSFPGRIDIRNVNLSGNLQSPTVMLWPDTTTRTLPNFGIWTYMNYTTTVNTAVNCWVSTGWSTQTYRRKLYDSFGFFDATNNQEAVQTDWTVHGYDGATLSGPPGDSSEVGRRQGDYIEWPTVGNMDGTRWYWGVPPGGDFVPDGIAGTSYVSPGYVGV